MAKKLNEEEKTLAEAFIYNLPVTRKQVAKALSVSVDTITDWTRQGMPCLYIGKVQRCERGAKTRYIIIKCLEWWEKRQ